jgi:RNA polymerase sigma factor (sigma-70 family)
MARHDRSLAESLFVALQNDDEAALRALLPPLRGRLQAIAKQRLAESLAEDTVQDTLTTLWTKRDALRSAGHVLPFIFQTLRNKIGNAYLQAKRRAKVSASSHHGEQESSRVAMDPESALEGEEFERKVELAIERCAAENETWGVVLRMLRAGHSPAKIRESLGDIPMATVHTRIFRARQRLKQILREEYDIDL